MERRRKGTVILAPMDMRAELKTFGRSKRDGITTLPWAGESYIGEFMSDTDDIFVRNRSPPRKWKIPNEICAATRPPSSLSALGIYYTDPRADVPVGKIQLQPGIQEARCFEEDDTNFHTSTCVPTRLSLALLLYISNPLGLISFLLSFPFFFFIHCSFERNFQ